jgi:hypothetical protein
MDALTLLRHAQDAGLHVEPAGDKLLVRGPRRAESVVKLLATHKTEILALLARAPDAPTTTAGGGSPAAEPAWWRDFFEERAAHRQYDGGYPRVQAEQLAFGEVILEWHCRHGARADPHRCAGCGDVLPGDADLILADGARVHFGGSRGVDCLLYYGAKWRGAAVEGLQELGLDPPDGFEL